MVRYFMKIYKYELSFENRNFIKMPEKSEIMDIQIQNGKPVMWALVDRDSPEIVVKINVYGTGWVIDHKATKDEYLATLQNGDLVWHFFMNYEL